MSPWVFYVIDVIRSLRVVMVITTVLSIVCLFFVLSCDDDHEQLPLGKWEFLLIFLVTGVVAAILAIFLPSPETMVQMLVEVTGTDIDHIRQIEEVTKAILGR